MVERFSVVSTTMAPLGVWITSLSTPAMEGAIFYEHAFDPTLSRLADAQLASPAADRLLTLNEYYCHDRDGGLRRYRLVANGSCAAPSVLHSGPGGAGASEIAVGGFEFVGLAVWIEPRQ